MSIRSLLLLVVLTFPITARGQASLSAGVSFPLAPEGFRDAYDPGFGMSGSFRLPLPELLIVPRLTAGFALHQIDEGSVEREGGNLSSIFVGFDGQLIRPHGLIKPYVAPFLGFAIFSAESFSEGETGIAIGGAVGVAFRLPPGPHLFVEARVAHAYLEGSDVRWTPVHGGVAFDLD